MYNKAVENYTCALEFVPECYKAQNMCDKAVNTYPFTIKFVPEGFMTQKICDKHLIEAFMFLILYLISIKTQEMCDTVVSEDPSLIVYCPDKYKTQRMYDEAVDDCLAVLKFVFDWFVAGEMITKLFTSLYVDEDILYFNEAFGDAVFNWNGMSILNIDLNNINLDNNFDENNPDSIILIRFFAWRNKFEKCK